MGLDTEALSFPLLLERVEADCGVSEEALEAAATLFRSLTFLAALCEGCDEDEDTFEEIEYPVAGVAGLEKGDAPPWLKAELLSLALDAREGRLVDEVEVKCRCDAGVEGEGALIADNVAAVVAAGDVVDVKLFLEDRRTSLEEFAC